MMMHIMRFPSGELLIYSNSSWCHGNRKSPGEECVVRTSPVNVRSSLMENEDMNPTRCGDCSSWRLDLI
jgi:hypothetical protein